jgi:branched-chain amino acid transport system ATP-binding protein
MTPLLEVHAISKHFGGIPAVAEVSFSVAAGTMLAMIGPNGAGKSTCFNIVGGQLRPDGGSVRLAGETISGRPPRAIWRRGVGRTFQITATFASMTLRENVQMALLSHYRAIWRAWRPTRGQYAEAGERLLAQVGLGAQADRAAGVLAYGDLKRLELAMALASQPLLLLMDEPTAGMAPAERVALMQLTREITQQRNIAVLFTEHDMDVVFGIADRILVLARGELIAEGDAAAIRGNQQVRDIYLGSGATSGGH